MYAPGAFGDPRSSLVLSNAGAADARAAETGSGRAG